MLLAIESSAETAGLCLQEGDRIVAEAALAGGAQGRSGLVARLGELLSENGIPAGSVGDVAVHVGPGSGTGLRMGVALAQSFCLVNPRVRVHAVPLEALAVARLDESGASHTDALLLADAQGGELFFLRLEKKGGGWIPCGELSAVSEAEVRSWEGGFIVLSTLSRPRHAVGWPAGWKPASGDFPTARLVARVASASGDFLMPIEKVAVRYLKRTSAEIQWERKNKKAEGRGAKP